MVLAANLQELTDSRDNIWVGYSSNDGEMSIPHRSDLARESCREGVLT